MWSSKPKNILQITLLQENVNNQPLSLHSRSLIFMEDSSGETSTIMNKHA